MKLSTFEVVCEFWNSFHITYNFYYKVSLSKPNFVTNGLVTQYISLINKRTIIQL